MIRVFEKKQEMVIITDFGFEFFKRGTLRRTGIIERGLASFMRGLRALGFKEI